MADGGREIDAFGGPRLPSSFTENRLSTYPSACLASGWRSSRARRSSPVRNPWLGVIWMTVAMQQRRRKGAMLTHLRMGSGWVDVRGE